MSIFIDLLLAFVICFALIKHLKLGLFCSILNLGKFIVSLIIAWLLGGYAGGLVAKLFPSVGGGKLFVILCYAFVFVVSYIIFTLIIRALSKVKLPIVTTIDKILGTLLGLLLGLLTASLISVIIYAILEICVFFSDNYEVMLVYSDSYVFKFIYDLKIFDFIANLF